MPDRDLSASPPLSEQPDEPRSIVDPLDVTHSIENLQHRLGSKRGLGHTHLSPGFARCLLDICFSHERLRAQVSTLTDQSTRSRRSEQEADALIDSFFAVGVRAHKAKPDAKNWSQLNSAYQHARAALRAALVQPSTDAPRSEKPDLWHVMNGDVVVETYDAQDGAQQEAMRRNANVGREVFQIRGSYWQLSTDAAELGENDGPIVCLRRFDPALKQMVFEPLPDDHKLRPSTDAGEDARRDVGNAYREGYLQGASDWLNEEFPVFGNILKLADKRFAARAAAPGVSPEVSNG